MYITLMCISVATLKSDNSPLAVCLIVGASSHTPKSCGFDPGSGHIPRLWVRSWVWACAGDHWSMFLSLPLSLSLSSPFLPL